MKRRIIKGKLAKIIGVKNSERIINVVTGVGRSGKTFETKKIIKKYARRFPKERILILDSFNEYKEYKEIQPNQVKTFRKPSRIITTKHNVHNVISSLIDFKGGLLVVEMRNMSIPQSELNIIIASLMFPRTKDFDVIIIDNSIEAIPPKLIHNTSVFRFHNSIQISDKLNLIHHYSKIAQCTVNDMCRSGESGDEYSFCYYDSENHKIIGAEDSSLFYACHFHFYPQIRQLQESLTTY